MSSIEALQTAATALAARVLALEGASGGGETALFLPFGPYAWWVGLTA